MYYMQKYVYAKLWTSDRVKSYTYWLDLYSRKINI